MEVAEVEVEVVVAEAAEAAVMWEHAARLEPEAIVGAIVGATVGADVKRSAAMKAKRSAKVSPWPRPLELLSQG